MSLPDVPIDTPMPSRRAPANRKIEYRCSRCGREVGRENLVSMQVRFRYVGAKGKDLRTRTSAWLCVLRQDDGSPSCLDLDPTWNLPDRRSPGMSPEVSAVAPGLTREAERPWLAAPISGGVAGGLVPAASPPPPPPEPVADEEPIPEPVPVNDPLLAAGNDRTAPPAEGPIVIQGW